jgi:hypothetical protein
MDTECVKFQFLREEVMGYGFVDLGEDVVMSSAL